jgi:hypothetical protein
MDYANASTMIIKEINAFALMDIYTILKQVDVSLTEMCACRGILQQDHAFNVL